MKKICILSALLLTIAVCGAQTRQKMSADMTRINRLEKLVAKSNYEHRMTNFRSDDNYESTTFSYDRQGRLNAVREYVAGEYEVIDSIFYNEQGQLVKLAGWQKMSANNWKNVYYVDYGYDAAGNISSRTNYNNIDGWQLGGVYSYTYNDQHQITLTILTMANTIFQKIEYTYADGQLFEELWYSYNGYGVSPDEKMTYYYENGLLSHVDDSASDDEGRTWANNGRQIYAYDEYGNCTEYHRYNSERTETNRSEYEYETNLPLSTTQIPWHPELERPKTYQNVHAYTVEHWYTVDVDWVLQYVCDYLYYYDNYTSIAERNEPQLSLYPNPTEGRVAIQAEQVQSTMVFNSVGQTVKTFGATSQIDLSDLPAGIYMLRVKTAEGVSMKQVVLQ